VLELMTVVVVPHGIKQRHVLTINQDTLRRLLCSDENFYLSQYI